MKRKIAVVWLSFMMILSCIVIVIHIAPTVKAPTTWYVDDVAGNSGPDDPAEDFTSILDAIDNATDGDTIFVYNGTYYENLGISKTINLIGEDKNATIIDGGGKWSVVQIGAVLVNITGFTIKNSGNNQNNAGIGLYEGGAKNCTIHNNKIINNYYGINILGFSGNNLTGNNISSNSEHGIHLDSTTDTYIVNNTLFGNGIFIEGDLEEWNTHMIDTSNNVNGKPVYYWKDQNGGTIPENAGQVILANCTNVQVQNLELANSTVGIELGFSSNNYIIDNNMTNIGSGIFLVHSNNNEIGGNNISSNKNGIYLSQSVGDTLTDNSIFEGGIYVGGNLLENWNTHHIDISNTANGRPIYYWKNQTGGSIPDGAGQVILANCSEIRVENQELINTSIGIQLGFSMNNSVLNNNLSNNLASLLLFESDNNNIINNKMCSNLMYGILSIGSNGNIIYSNTVYSNLMYGILSVGSNGNFIYGNTIYLNNLYGLYVFFSWNNHIYHNNIINNNIQAYDNQNNNYWDNGYPSGGNYWSDYGGVDEFQGPGQNIQGSDGIGDTPYIDIGGNTNAQDNYPLMHPFENYSFLNEGWNLISIPFTQSNTNLSSVLSSISGSYDTVWKYNISDKQDYWKLNHTSKPTNLNDFNNIDNTMGFWIHITEPGGILFQYPGTQPTKNRTIALNNLTFGAHVDSIWTYNSAIQRWEEIEEGDMFYPGRGYWIHAKEKCEWEVPL